MRGSTTGLDQLQHLWTNPTSAPLAVKSLENQLGRIGHIACLSGAGRLIKQFRRLIKQLLAEAGGDQARAVLSVISRVPPVMNVAEPRAKQQQQRGEGDEVRWDWSEAGIAL